MRFVYDNDVGILIKDADIKRYGGFIDNPPMVTGTHRLPDFTVSDFNVPDFTR